MQTVNVISAKKIYERFWFVSFFSLALAFALLLLYYRWEHERNPDLIILREIAREAGFAALVAFFLNLSVEWINRRRHMEQESSLVRLIDEKHHERIETLLGDLRAEHAKLLLALSTALEEKHQVHMSELLRDLDAKYNETSKRLLKNVFQTVYERYIEEGIFKIIDAHVLRKDVMRKKYKSSITIKTLDAPNPENFVNLCFVVRYEVVNLTDLPITNPVIELVMDVTPGYEDKCRFVSAKINNERVADDTLRKATKSKQDGAFIQLTIDCVIPPRGTVKVEVIYNKVGPRNFSEVICSTVQMDSFTMEVISHVPDLAVFATSLHPEDEDHTPDPINKGNSSWVIDHAILPGQGIVVFWHPKSSRLVVPQIDDAQPEVAQLG